MPNNIQYRVLIIKIINSLEKKRGQCVCMYQSLSPLSSYVRAACAQYVAGKFSIVRLCVVCVFSRCFIRCSDDRIELNRNKNAISDHETRPQSKCTSQRACVCASECGV